MKNTYHFHNLNLEERTRQLHKMSDEKNESVKKHFHGFLSHKELDREYNELMNQKYLKSKGSIINLTSEELKKQYDYKYNYFISGIKFMLLLSIMLIFNSFMEFKYLKPSEINISIFILSIISAGFCLMLIVNLNSKALIDTFGYLAFYLFSIIETCLFAFVFLLKFYNFKFLIREIYKAIIGNNIIKYPSYSPLIFLLIFNIIMFSGIIFCFKFIWHLFFEAINIVLKKEKTLFQKQLELNLIENNAKSRKIEFTDEESLDSINVNSNYDMKIE